MAFNVLIVDDSSTMRKIIVRCLRQAGLAIDGFIEAKDGHEGLALLQSTPVDLILTDVNMPNMNGLDFVEIVRDRLADPPPIVMITTEGSEEVVREAMRRGASAYVRKPFTADHVHDVIGSFVTPARNGG